MLNVIFEGVDSNMLIEILFLKIQLVSIRQNKTSHSIFAININQGNIQENIASSKHLIGK